MKIKNLFLAIAAIFLISRTESMWIETNGSYGNITYLTLVLNGSSNSEPCLTSECYEVANSIKKSMDRDVNPCEDFYRFTCGRWEESHPAFLDGEPQTEFDVYQALTYERIRDILNEELKSNDILPVRQAKKLYRSCSDKETREKRGLEPLFRIVEQAGNWPLVMNENDVNYGNYGDHSWQEVDRLYARLTGHNTFYDVINDPLGHLPRITIVPSRLLEARSSWVSHKWFMPRIIYTYTNYQEPNPKFDSEISKLLNFEQELIQLSARIKNVLMLKSQNFENINGNKSRHEIDLKSGIQTTFDRLKIKVDPETMVRGLEYLQALKALLKKTPSRTILNYVHWNFVASMIMYTNNAMMYEIHSITKGFSHEPSWMECVDVVKNTMKYAVDYLFEKKYYPKRTQRAVLEMIKNIKNSLEANVDNSNWLDNISKIEAKELLKGVSVLSDSVKWYRNKTALTHFYKDLEVGTKYFENGIKSMRFQTQGELIPDWRSKSRLDLTYQDPLIMNAMYIETVSQIDFERFLDISPAILQPPLFIPGLPESVNYGQAGFTIGHELGHGFDYRGFRVSSKIMMRNYYQKARCFIKQFDKYFNVIKSPENEKIRESSRGFRTVSENIADSTGLQAVFQAYKNLMKKKKLQEFGLPGLEDFTTDQMFFISYGVRQCARSLVGKSLIHINDTHSPQPFRLIGSVSNTDDFAKVFNCPLGSPMNPDDKCNIWKHADKTLNNYVPTD